MSCGEDRSPVAFSPEYEPRRRALTAEELAKLLAKLTADRAARVAFIVATSACWRETELARRGDVGEGLATGELRLQHMQHLHCHCLDLVHPLERMDKTRTSPPVTRQAP